MPYYNTCPNCGANLDPGETCECCNEIRANSEKMATLFIRLDDVPEKYRLHIPRNTSPERLEVIIRKSVEGILAHEAAEQQEAGA